MVRGACRSISTSGRTISRPPTTWRKSKATAARTRWLRSGFSRQSWSTRNHSDCDIRHDTVSRQHLGVVGTEAAARQGDVDLPRDLGEVRVDLGAAGIGVGECVVLVGGQGRLAPGRRSEREPRPRDGRRPAWADAARSAACRGVGLERDDPATSSGETPARMRLTTLRQVAGGVDELVDARGVGDRPAKRERRSALEVHQVGRGDDAQRRPGRVDDREVMDAGSSMSIIASTARLSGGTSSPARS